jgi:uncharacterized protein
LIYVDTSVVLASVLAEDLRPPAAWWRDQWLVSSRLCEYESWVRLHAYGRGPSHGRVLAGTLACLDLLELADPVCARTRAPFPGRVRTLDALHLASIDFLGSRGFSLRVATYDRRLQEAAIALGHEVIAP